MQLWHYLLIFFSSVHPPIIPTALLALLSPSNPQMGIGDTEKERLNESQKKLQNTHEPLKGKTSPPEQPILYP